jgi:hypothetical protein
MPLGGSERGRGPTGSVNVQSIFNHHEPSRDHRALPSEKRYVGNLPPMPGVFPDYPAPARPYRRVERHFSAVRGSEPLPSVTVFVRGVSRQAST